MGSRTNEIGIEYFDDLTGLYNRRFLNKKSFQYIQEADRNKTIISVVVIDLDHFKNINDTYGHSTGDTVLSAVASFFRDILRTGDTVYRYGGDEFICILPDTRYKQAVRIASRFLEQCRSREFSKIRLTCSIGIASFPIDGRDWLSVFNAADRRLYSAKRHGRDRIGAFTREYTKVITPTSEMVDREDEIHRIKSIIARKAGDSIRAVNISGEIGVGKTRLVHEIAGDPGYKDVVFLESILSPTTRSIPYYPFREIIRSVIRKKGIESLIDIPQAFQIELLKIIPELADEMEKPVSGNVFMLDKFRLFEGVCKFLERQAYDSPLFLCLDNIHWADDNSLELFNYLIRTLAGSSIFFFFIYRVEEAKSDSFKSVLHSLNREKLYECIELKPLEQADVARMLSLIVDASPSPELRAFIYRETGGNPLFIEELTKSLEISNALIWEDGSVSIDEGEKIVIPYLVKTVVDRKMGMMGHQACELLEYAVIIGREFDFSLLPVITGKNEGYLLDLLDEILSMRLLRECDEERYRFAEDVVRETIYQQISTAKSKFYHRIVGNALEKLYENRTEEVIEELTHHYYLCSENDKVITYGLIAADRAKNAYANQDAIEFYSKVLECLPESGIENKVREIEILMKRASVLNLVGDREKAIEDLTEAVRNSQSLGEQKLEADSLVALCKVHFGISHYTDTIEMAGNALEIYRALVDKKGEATSLNCIGIANWYLGEFESALKLYKSSLNIAETTADRKLEAMILGNISIIYWNIDDYSTSLDYYTRALDITREIDDLETETRALNNIGLIHATIGDNEKAM
ncbi:MAG: diguanylate cyclase, partial [Candidatus Aegiribacteria sp.]|nr:diguanylate cyclase [Candidatus Aegiribacteria sp.]